MMQVMRISLVEIISMLMPASVRVRNMRDASGVSAQLFRALYEAGINIEMISTSEIRISVVTRADSVHAAARAVHTAFELDAEEDAVVHAGTGR